MMKLYKYFFSLLFIFLIHSGVSDAKAVVFMDSESTILKTSVYADASSGEIVIYNPVETNYVVQIFDLTGKEILRREFTSEDITPRISDSRLRRGIYLVRITPSSDLPSVTAKVMIR